MSCLESGSFHILQIVIKNTSTLDFSMPLLWGLREKYPDAKISILYTSLNKSQILRDSKFMYAFCDKNKIQQYDLCDFLSRPGVPLSDLIRGCFASSYSDTTRLSAIKEVGQGKSLKVIKAILLRYMRPLERIVSRLFVAPEQIMVKLNPDLVLFDNRSVTDFPGRDVMYGYFESAKKPVVLLPHAPHYIGAGAEFCRFDEHNDNLMPEYTEHWMPFKYGEPWKVAPSHRAQFINIGYPGLDTSWWEYISSDKKVNKKIRCLVLARKCLPKHQQRPIGFDESTLDYEEGMNFYAMLNKTIREAGFDIEIVVKPHPSSSEPENHEMLSAVGLENYVISYESFYDLLPSIDVVVSQFTTALSLSIAYNIPTMLVETKLQHSVHDRWPILADFYLNLKYYSMQSEFSSNFVQLIAEISAMEKSTADKRNLRRFFDDGSLELAINRVEVLLGKKNGTS
jgi:hypothetical protein